MAWWSGPARALSTAHAPPLAFVSSHINICSPEKKKSEDAVLAHPSAIAVADGVGGWASSGVDPSKYPQALLGGCLDRVKELETAGESLIPLDIATAGFNAAKGVKGSSTLCVATAAADGGIGMINVGDSVALVLAHKDSPTRQAMQNLTEAQRNLPKGFPLLPESDGYAVVFRSKVQQHYFNCPLQLGTDTGDHPQMGQQQHLPVHPGDMVILGTDGVFDNVFVNTIQQFCNQENTQALYDAAQSLGTPGAHKDLYLQLRRSLDGIGSSLAEVASAFGEDTEAMSPFSVEAAAAGYKYKGGKLDDVGLVVSFVVPRSPEAVAAQAIFCTGGEGDPAAAEPAPDTEQR
ncbi:unnamed protein product [Symbiodinium sp. KB8]|nr:unnamed protein product [Symbiodinium sp. KB8]